MFIMTGDGEARKAGFIRMKELTEAGNKVIGTYCHTYAIESKKVGDFVTGELGLPYLCLTSDYSDSDQGQLATRINAFVEMML